VLERAYNICSDLGLVAATLVHGGLGEVERMQVRAGNPVRPMLAQRMSSAAEILAKLGGSCAAEYKYDGVRVQGPPHPDGASSCSPAAWSGSRTSSRTGRAARQGPGAAGG
jgi:DNA ligase-1